MADLDVSFIVVSYNTVDLTRSCLQSILDQSSGFTYEVIVVDNDSTDGSAQMVAEEFPEATLLANKENLGFAGANNQAFEVVQGRYVLLLNPDAEILDNAAGRCLAFAGEHPDAGVIGCRVMLPDGNQQSTMFRYQTLGFALINLIVPARWIRRSRLLGRIRYVGRDLDAVHEAEVIAGCFMLVPSQVLERVGGMDKDFFMYGEEAEWCYRIRRAGWKNMYFPGAAILHHAAASAKQETDTMAVNMSRGQLLFIHKTQGPIAAWLTNLIMLLRDLPRVLLWGALRSIPGMRDRPLVGLLRPAAIRFGVLLRGLVNTEWSGKA
ncbi:MAG: glycosyltransferase family 2 protein [bacterium]|nr:glycosyltransferase family 2 protein [bacterium]